MTSHEPAKFTAVPTSAKDLRCWKRREFLVSSEQVLVSVGQLGVELLQLRVSRPHDHLLHVHRARLGHKLDGKRIKFMLSMNMHLSAGEQVRRLDLPNKIKATVTNVKL